jgi:alcohol dehydrogenase, propanol-preferring
VVIGVGGLGHLAVQVIRATSGARVVAVDMRDSARDLALQHGADLALYPGPDLVTQIRDFTGGVGADVVVDFVGSDDTLATATACARQLGDITIVGIAGGTLPVSFFGVPYEVSVQTTYWGNRRELVEVLDLAARGLLAAETSLYTLDDAASAYQDLAHGTVKGRAVVVPTDAYRPVETTGSA